MSYEWGDRHEQYRVSRNKTDLNLYLNNKLIATVPVDSHFAIAEVFRMSTELSILRKRVENLRELLQDHKAASSSHNNQFEYIEELEGADEDCED